MTYVSFLNRIIFHFLAIAGCSMRIILRMYHVCQTVSKGIFLVHFCFLELCKKKDSGFYNKLKNKFLNQTLSLHFSRHLPKDIKSQVLKSILNSTGTKDLSTATIFIDDVILFGRHHGLINRNGDWDPRIFKTLVTLSEGIISYRIVSMLNLNTFFYKLYAVGCQ